MYNILVTEEADEAFLKAGVIRLTNTGECTDRVLLEFSLLLLERIKSLEDV